jgi:hypothetical protein
VGFLFDNIFINKIMKYVISESQIIKISRLLYEEDSKETKVKKIQKFLVDKGYDLGDYGDKGDGVDGKYGPLTKKAVEDFQKKVGNLEIDGKVGPKTAEAMGGNIESVFGTSKNDTETNQDSVETKKSELTTDNEYAIIRPSGYKGNKVHVLFGGAHTSGYSKGSARPENIKKYVKVMTPYANDVIIVITHHMNSLENVRKYVQQKFGGVVNSIAGFSQGGRETWRHAGDSSLSLVGLIDPSTYETGLSFGANTILYCDPKNWGTSGFYGQTRKRLEWYCSNQKKYGGKVICFNQGGTHMNFGILKDFYSQFGGKL